MSVVIKNTNSNALEDYREEKTKDSRHSIIKVKTKDGWKAVDSPYEPLLEAREITERINPSVEHVLMLGAGSGFVVRELSTSTVSDIMIITGSRVLAEKNRDIFLKNDITTGSVSILYSREFSDELEIDIRNFLSNHPDAYIILHPREYKAFPYLFNPLLMLVHQVKDPLTKRNNRLPEKILFPSHGQIIEPDLHDAFKRMGIEVIKVESFAHNGIDHQKAWDILSAHDPDFIFSTNNKGSDKNGFIPEACARSGIPWATWFLDEPKFLVTKDEIRAGQERISFCWDIAGVEPCRELGFTNVELLPLATNERLFFPGEGDPSLVNRIVYVGSPSFGNEEKYFAGILRDPAAQRLAKIFESELIAKRQLPELQSIYDVLDNLDIKKNHFSPGTIRRLPAYCLYKANLTYRINALNALADLRPVVYGDGWYGLLPETIELRSYIDYYRDLPAIYRSDAVHLSLTHLQMRRYPNQRVFDIGICGRIVLGERLEGWESLFGTDFDELLFSDVQKLREKANILVHNKQHRKRLGDGLRSIILKQHTLFHRVNTIINRVFKV